jgi:hypothetical protein
METLAALVTTYRRLAADGIEPVRCFNHGVATSMYYRDPDGNEIELSVEHFADVDALNAWLATGDFDENPAGVALDPRALADTVESGVDEATLLRPDLAHRTWLADMMRPRERVSAPDASGADLVVCTGTVAAPLSIVWDLVSDFGAVDRWSIDPVRCTVDGSGVGAIRTVQRGDRTVRERLEHWDATDHSFSYSFVDDMPLPVTDLVATISVRDASTGGRETEITWSARGEVAEPDRAVVHDTLARFFTGRIGELQTIAARLVEEH